MTKASRNNPCTCGSGKKFKKCCGLKVGLAKYKTTLLGSSKVSDLLAKKIPGFSNSTTSLNLAEHIQKS